MCDEINILAPIGDDSGIAKWCDQALLINLSKLTSLSLTSLYGRQRAALTATLDAEHRGRSRPPSMIIYFQLKLKEYRNNRRKQTIKPPPNVEGSDSKGISSSYETLVTCVQQNEREHSIQHVHKLFTVVLILAEHRQINNSLPYS